MNDPLSFKRTAPSRKSSYYITFLLLVLAVSCKVQHPSIDQPLEAPMITQGPAWGAAWQQKAGEYRALCFQAYNLAQLRLDELLKESYKKPVALVTDIDETVLDNSPYQVHLATQNEVYSDTSWMEWTAKVDCDTVPGALSFLKYAKSKGVAVFYITNRMEKERSATLKNLQFWGFPDAVDEHLILKTTTSGKEPRRKKVGENYEILLLLGDNLSDFSPAFDKKALRDRNQLVQKNSILFGRRFIVLPNSMYGDWSGALFEYQYQLPAKEKEKAIFSTLKRY